MATRITKIQGNTLGGGDKLRQVAQKTSTTEGYWQKICTQSQSGKVKYPNLNWKHVMKQTNSTKNSKCKWETKKPKEKGKTKNFGNTTLTVTLICTTHAFFPRNSNNRRIIRVLIKSAGWNRNNRRQWFQFSQSEFPTKEHNSKIHLTSWRFVRNWGRILLVTMFNYKMSQIHKSSCSVSDDWTYCQTT